MLKMFSPRKASLPAKTPPGSPTSASDVTSFSKTDSSSLVSPTSADAILVDGLDIARWREVTVEVPPGPLGILLDGTCANAAMIEQFSGVAPSGKRGAIEASGAVPIGSVLVAVNEIDFLAARASLEGIGQVLRDTSQLARRLRFRVPPSTFKERETSEAEVSNNDKRKLLGGHSSSYEESVNATVESSKGWSWGGIASTLAMLSPSSIPAAPKNDGSAFDSPPASPSVASSSFMDVTAMESSPPMSSVTAQGLPGHRVSVNVPSGPLGVNLDGSIADHAVVLGFTPLSDGSKGKLEQHGGIQRGSVLVSINGEDVSTLSLASIREKLGASSRSSRRLVFHVPAAPLDEEPASHPDEAKTTSTKRRLSYSTAPDSVEDLLQRRRLELALVMKHDRAELKFKECWFLVDAEWMKKWAAFVGRGGAPPGPISNHSLLSDGWRSRVSGAAMGRPDEVRPGLQLATDYRCVVPMVWALLSALHGDGEAPPLARYSMDINSEPLSQGDVDFALRVAKPQALALAATLRSKCEVDLAVEESGRECVGALRAAADHEASRQAWEASRGDGSAADSKVNSWGDRQSQADPMLMLLRCAFGRRMVDGEGEWSGVPEVLRSSFLLLTKELRHLNARVAALEAADVTKGAANAITMQTRAMRDEARTCVPEIDPTCRDAVARVQRDLQEMEQTAIRREVRWKRRVKRLQGEVAHLRASMASSVWETRPAPARSDIAVDSSRGVQVYDSSSYPAKCAKKGRESIDHVPSDYTRAGDNGIQGDSVDYCGKMCDRGWWTSEKRPQAVPSLGESLSAVNLSLDDSGGVAENDQDCSPNHKQQRELWQPTHESELRREGISGSDKNGSHSGVKSDAPPSVIKTAIASESEIHRLSLASPSKELESESQPPSPRNATATGANGNQRLASLRARYAEARRKQQQSLSQLRSIGDL